MDVLVVDDDPDVRHTHVKLLERAGFMVRAVDNGLAAIAELQRHPFKWWSATSRCRIDFSELVNLVRWMAEKAR